MVKPRQQGADRHDEHRLWFVTAAFGIGGLGGKNLQHMAFPVPRRAFEFRLAFPPVADAWHVHVHFAHLRTPRPQPILLVYSSPRPTPHKRRRILSILLLFLLRTMPSPRPLAVCTFPSAPCIALRRIRTCRNQICPPNDRPCTTISTHTSQPTPGQATELQQPRPRRYRRCLRRSRAVIGARA